MFPFTHCLTTRCSSKNIFARGCLSVNVFVSISSGETGWYFSSMEFRRYVPVGSHPWPFLDDNKANTASESVENSCYYKAGTKQHGLKFSNKEPKEPFELYEEDLKTIPQRVGQTIITQPFSACHDAQNDTN